MALVPTHYSLRPYGKEIAAGGASLRHHDDDHGQRAADAPQLFSVRSFVPQHSRIRSKRDSRSNSVRVTAKSGQPAAAAGSTLVIGRIEFVVEDASLP
jgi:hypothetical protein